MKRGLNATQLKIIAIIAMTIDHIAWGFLDVLSVPGQILHVMGRLTIPIMCFFIAEGYRKTSDLRAYVQRMVAFSIVAAYPFYLFFNEEYGYRQNFVFDLTLALLALTICNSDKLKKWQKVILFALVIIISATIGGWPILPILLVLIFYYVKDFKKACLFVIFAISSVEVFLISFVFLNGIYGFAPRYSSWVWYQWLYFFGFVLALPLLKLYNGDRGKYPIGRYFFYFYYPVHFIVLWAFKKYFITMDRYSVYLAFHILCLLIAVAITIRAALARPSRAQVTAVIVGMSGTIFIIGFIVEIFSSSLDIAYAGTIVEYFGTCATFLSISWFVSELYHIKIPKLFYVFEGLFSGVVLVLLFTTRTNHFFYESMSIDNSGTFPRLSLVHGRGFTFFLVYIASISCGCILFSIKRLIVSKGVESKRIRLIMWGILSPWIAALIRGMGITNGYEISAVGVLGSMLFIYFSLFKYGFFDSIQLAGENALLQMDEGIIVIEPTHKIVYVNKKALEIIPSLESSINRDVTKYTLVESMLSGEIREAEFNEKHFEILLVTLEERGFIQGKMIVLRDDTEKYQRLKEAERYANTDMLTGLRNRSCFKKDFDVLQSTPVSGYVLMLDLDDFKKVNDTKGHGVGDRVLIILAETINEFETDYRMFGRIGGDEFCGFVGKISDEAEITALGNELITRFSDNLETAGFKDLTSVSIGAAYFDKTLPEGKEANEQLSAVYKLADEALYKSKNNGKGSISIYS